MIRGMEQTDPRILAALDAWCDEENRRRRLERGLVEQARELGFPGTSLREAVEFLRDHQGPPRKERRK